MISWFFNFCYIILILIFSPFLLYSRVFHGKYREGFAQKFFGSAPILPAEMPSRKRVWIHAVSVGEVNLAVTIFKEFQKRHPDFEFVISTTSQTGMELARKKFPEQTVFYAPLDFSWAVRRAIRNIKPNFLVLIELEIWPNLLRAARSSGVPVAVMNGRLGNKSFRNYSRIRGVISRVMRRISLVTAQDAASAEHFQALGVDSERVFNVGSIKYDGAQSDRKNEKTRRLAALWNIQSDDRIFLAGSTQDPEEKMAVEVFRRLAPTHPELRLILVPRHPERFEEVWKMLENTEFSVVRRAQLNENQSENQSENLTENQNVNQNKNHRESILLVDCIGELGGWWGTSYVGFVGGSMGSRGGQNMLEPAAYGTAVSFGPNTWNFRDIVTTLLAHEAAVVVKNDDEMTDFVRRTLEEPNFADELGGRAAKLVASQQGALQKTLDLFDRILGTHDTV